MTDTPKALPKSSMTFKLAPKKKRAEPKIIEFPILVPYLSKSGQLLMPKGLLPILAQTPNDINMVENALRSKRHLAIIQPQKEGKFQKGESQKQLYQIGCVGRITTFSENDDGSLYIVVKGLSRFQAQSVKSGLLQVDYAPFAADNITLQIQKPITREPLMGLLKNYLERINIDVNWSDLLNASDESLTTSLAMMCPFDANEKQAILESETLKERFDMITAFIEMSEMKHAPQNWTSH